jgi:hypothetical protein
LAGNGGGLCRYFVESIASAIIVDLLVLPRETLRYGFPDQTMMALWCHFSLGSIVCGVVLDTKTYGGEVKSCLPD